MGKLGIKLSSVFADVMWAWTEGSRKEEGVGLLEVDSLGLYSGRRCKSREDSCALL